jgi:hypothetical protein
MNYPNKTIFYASVFLFAAGVLLSLIFIIISVWGGLEASLFDTSIREETYIRPYDCPIVITRQETGIVRASFSNPTGREVTRRVHTNISEGRITLMRRISTDITIAPGQTKVVEYEVYPEDAAFDRFIFVRTRALRTAPFPSASSACGIMVVGLPGVTGNQIVAFLLVGGILGTILGWSLFTYIHRPLQGKIQHLAQSMFFLVVLSLIGIAAGWMSQWILGIFALVLILFILIEIWVYLGTHS